MRPRVELPARLLAAALALQTAVAVGSAVRLSDDRPPVAAPRSQQSAPQADPLGGLLPGATTRAAPAPTAAAAERTPPDVGADRAAAAEALLRARSAALLRRDRAAFLASVDPQQRDFQAQQGRLFDALAAVPLRSWAYTLDARDVAPPDPALDARYRAPYWVPAVTLRYALEGVDPRPTAELQALTFVLRGDRWVLASDEDRADRAAPRGLWDSGPVAVVRGEHSLVLGRPGHEAFLRRTAREADAAVATVTEVFGDEWVRRVAVLVPATGAELDALLAEGQDLSAIAAVATARLDGPPGSTVPVGDRVVLNPVAFGRLGAGGRRVVLTHEVTHVATRRVTGPAAPAWLVEGYADHVGYTGAGIPVTSAARELTADVRAGRVPARLPADEDFAGTNPALPQAYEGAWLACELIAREHGRDALRRFYLTVGAARGSADEAVRAALRDVLGTTPEAFTVRWREDLRRQLAA